MIFNPVRQRQLPTESYISWDWTSRRITLRLWVQTHLKLCHWANWRMASSMVQARHTWKTWKRNTDRILLQWTRAGLLSSDHLVRIYLYYYHHWLQLILNVSNQARCSSPKHCIKSQQSECYRLDLNWESRSASDGIDCTEVTHPGYMDFTWGQNKASPGFWAARLSCRMQVKGCNELIHFCGFWQSFLLNNRLFSLEN